MQKRMVLKGLMLLGVTAVLLGVLSSIGGLTRERKIRLDEVELDIANSYAGSQHIGGPIFSVTWREFWTERLYNEEKNTWYEKEMSTVRTQLLYPAVFSYTGTLAVEERKRGIFKANVFQSAGLISGNVHFPEFSSLTALKEARMELMSVNACLLVSDPRGIATIPQLLWNGKPVAVEAGSTLEVSESGIHATLPDPESLFGKPFEFSMTLNVNGTGRINFIPVGDENHIQLESSWPHPSFVGDFLATKRTITDQGFSANWNVNGLACSARKDINEDRMERVQMLGVNLINPINPYPLTDRALKYGFLFIFITFAAFWLFEILAALRIHPIQYSFVGLAQAIFFLLLLSLSEHVGFGLSYAVASLATIGLIVFYVCHILRGLPRGLAFGGLLALLYSVLYVLLQSEDHALVAGSALLFGLMTLVMVLTRKIDWYAIGQKTTEGVKS